MKGLSALGGGSPRIKAIIHAFQGIVIFIAWAMTIAVFTRDGDTDGRTAYYFALCWVTYPALIYLAAFPLWPRTKRFANVYAFTAIDCLFGLLWFVAWICVATYVGSGKGKGDNKKKSGCDNFKYGSPGKCKLSTGTIILGVIVFLTFIATSYLSFKGLTDFRRTGALPYDSGYDPTFAAQSSEAFSSNLNPSHDLDDEESHRMEDSSITDSRVGGYSSLGGRPDDEYAPMHQQSDVSDIHRPVPYDPSIYSGPSPSPRPPSAGRGAGMVHLPPVDTSYGSPFDDLHRRYDDDQYGYGR